MCPECLRILHEYRVHNDIIVQGIVEQNVCFRSARGSNPFLKDVLGILTLSKGKND